MLNEKRIKTLIIVSILVIELLVWTFSGFANSLSYGIIGGADGPTRIFVGHSVKPEDQKPPEGQPGGNNGQTPDRNGSDGLNPAEGEPENEGNGTIDGQASDHGYPPEDTRDRETALKEARENGLLILVNKEHHIDKDYKPEDLRKIRNYVPDRAEETRYLRAEAAAAFHQMVERAAQDGVEIKMTTAYRSYGFQQMLFDSYVEKEGEEKANTFSAKPGQSEHQTGLSVDVSSPSVDYQLSNDYGKTKEGKWIADHAYRFGFILRFPNGKEDITGYQYEPWHLRYVGIFAAKEIHEQQLTLEEYLQIVKQ